MMNNKNLVRVFILFACIVLANVPAYAVNVSPNGEGQVLLYPYYVTRDNNDTLISIANHTPDVKALKVRLHEGENGRVIQAFNLYLGPYDFWSARIGEGFTEAEVFSTERSCTVPQSPVFPLDLSLLATGPDSGRTSLDRAMEGYIEVIEMGTVARPGLGDFAAPIFGSDPAEFNCDPLVEAWEEGGVWRTDPQTDMLPPTGGLSGDAVVINVPAARASAYQATALANFYRRSAPVSLHSAPEVSDMPSLADAFPAISQLYVDDGVNPRVVTDEWQDGITAVTASLMSNRIDAQYILDSTIGAVTDVVFTMPTKHALSATANTLSEPFTASFDEPESGVGDGLACEGIVHDHNSRNAVTFPKPLVTPPAPDNILCYSVNVISYGGDDRSDIDLNIVEANNEMSGILASRLYIRGFTFPNESGWVAVSMSAPAGFSAVHQLTNPTSGRVYVGLPVVGFVARGATNRSINANFGSGYPLRHTREVREQ